MEEVRKEGEGPIGGGERYCSKNSRVLVHSYPSFATTVLYDMAIVRMLKPFTPPILTSLTLLYSP